MQHKLSLSRSSVPMNEVGPPNMERRRSAHGRAMLGNRATHNHSMGNYMNALDEIARGMHDEPQWKRAALALAESSVFDAILVHLFFYSRLP